MPYCSRCDREDISTRWEFCPRCGAGLAHLTPVLKSTKVVPQAKDVKGMLVDMALDLAQGVAQKTLTAKLSPPSQGAMASGTSKAAIVDMAFNVAKELAKKQLTQKFSPANKFMTAGSFPSGAFIDLAFDVAKGLAQKKLSEKLSPANQSMTASTTDSSHAASSGECPHWYKEVVTSGAQPVDRTELAKRQAQAIKNSEDRQKYAQMAWSILQNSNMPSQSYPS